MKYPSENPSLQLPAGAESSPGAGYAGAEHRVAGPSGVDSPRTVIRGESFGGISAAPLSAPATDFTPLAGVHRFAAHTDWLNCTLPAEDHPQFLSTFIRDLCSIVGDRFAPVTERGVGLHGWRRSFKLGDTGALLGIGGQNGTLFLSLHAEACRLVALDAWPVLAALLEHRYRARITRWDGAADDYEGIHNVDWAVAQYLAGQFNSGGNKPLCEQKGNWLEPDGRGRSFYVGQRCNGKMIRIYEKGKQLGDPNSLWVRWEVELHNRDREIPWDVLLNPGGYVAGAYPCTRWVSEIASRIKTARKTARIGYDRLTHYAKLSYGPLLNVMMEKEGSAERVVEMLRRDGVPARLNIPIPPESVGPECDQ